MALVISSSAVNAQETPEESTQLPVWMENVYLGGSIGATTAITDVKQYDLYPVQKYMQETDFFFAIPHSYLHQPSYHQPIFYP